jgi:hypothetical protein
LRVSSTASCLKTVVARARANRGNGGEEGGWSASYTRGDGREGLEEGGRLPGANGAEQRCVLVVLKRNRIIRKRTDANFSSFHLRVFLGLLNPLGERQTSIISITRDNFGGRKAKFKQEMSRTTHSTKLQLRKLRRPRTDSGRASTLELLRGLPISREVLWASEPRLSLYSTRTKLGSTLEAKLTLSAGRSRGVMSVLWAKVGLEGPTCQAGRVAKLHGHTNFPTSDPLLTDLT